MKEFRVGIDGGGTKTKCLFLESSRTEMPEQPLSITGAGSNPHIVGFEEAARRIKELVLEGCTRYNISPEQIASIGIGLAGLGRANDIKRMEEALDALFFSLNLSENTEYYIESDSEIALEGALAPEVRSGMLVIAGTGSNAVARDEVGGFYRCGGWGHLLGDEGGAYYLSLKALSSVAKAQDGRGPRTMLSELVLQALDLEHEQGLIQYMYEKPREKQEVAQLASLVIKACEKGDEVATRLIEEAADELVLHVAILAKQSAYFNERTPVTVAGSMFTFSPTLKRAFQNRLLGRKLGVFQEPHAPPEFGAVMLGKKAENVREGGGVHD
ncbi:N-acetylglucosamine kinase [Halobacillus salinus]|uniref:N-acetylglucosamine kinase n=1 Tax=Halobacillus salinus TaxID=192814 RepID=UPI0009A83EB8|nr:BadF/BadG/BcrA/BcrD ATPase family protein [Halobacillus salinus]